MLDLFTYKNRTKQRVRGFTLTELGIVLAIITVIVGAIWVAATSVNNSASLQKSAQIITQVLHHYRQMYALKGIDITCANGVPCDGTYPNVTCIGENSGFFPADMIPAGACSEANLPMLPWPGVTMGVQVSAPDNVIQVYVNNLSHANCVALASLLYSSPEMTVQYISSSAGTFGNNLAPGMGGTPWSVADIDTKYCGTGNTNMIEYGIAAK